MTRQQEVEKLKLGRLKFLFADHTLRAIAKRYAVLSRAIRMVTGIRFISATWASRVALHKG
jgi:hypothetical protein